MRQIISLVVVLALVCAVSAQTPTEPFGTTKSTSAAAKEKSGLEKAIEEALKSNPDLRVAAAKVNEAQAGLSRARLQVTQKVVSAYQAVEIARATVNISQATLERLRRLHQDKLGVAKEDITKAEQELTAAKGKLATAEADLNYLLGKSAARGLPDGRYIISGLPTDLASTTLLWGHLLAANERNLTLMPYVPFSSDPTTAKATIPAADKIRKALDRRINMKFTDTSARDVLKMIQKEAEGLHIQASLKDQAWNEKLTATLTEVPLGAVLQLLEDTLGDYRTIVRGYGLLIVPRERMPAGAVLLGDFWQGGVKGEAAANKPATSKPGAR
jgi:hypothetical protein